jgi:hypothetical protein
VHRRDEPAITTIGVSKAMEGSDMTEAPGGEGAPAPAPANDETVGGKMVALMEASNTLSDGAMVVRMGHKAQTLTVGIPHDRHNLAENFAKFEADREAFDTSFRLILRAAAVKLADVALRTTAADGAPPLLPYPRVADELVMG